MADNYKPLITVGVPYHNTEAYIGACIESILAQKYENIEIILADDHSTDASAQIAHSYQVKDNRIKCITSVEPGPSAVRNSILGGATGEYLLFVDSDDTVEPDMIDRMIDVALSCDADLVMCAYNACSAGRSGLREVRGLKPGIYDGGARLHKLFLTEGRNYNHMWGKLFRCSVFTDVQFPQVALYEDIAVLPLIIENTHKCIVMNEALYNYTLRSDSSSYDYDICRHMDGLRVREANADFYRRLYPELEGVALDSAVEFAFYLCGRIIRSGMDSYRQEWKNVTRRLDEMLPGAPLLDLHLKLAAGLYRINRRLAAGCFMWYSEIKNRTK